MARLDPHSYADDTQPADQVLRLERARRLRRAEHCARRSRCTSRSPPPVARSISTRAPSRIDAVLDPDGTALEHTLHPAEPILGSRLAIAVPAGARDPHPLPHVARGLGAAVARRRRRRSAASTRSCSASARRSTRASVLPCQDTPRSAQTFTAPLDVPSELRAVMAAAPRGARRARRSRDRALRDAAADPAVPLRVRGGRSRRRGTSRRARACGRSPRSSRPPRGSSPHVERSLARGRGAVRPLRLGALRPAHDAALVPLRRHGEPAAHLPHADAARRRPQPGERGGARARALVDRQPRHQRQRRALLAQRGLHGLRRAAHPRGARGRGDGGAPRGARLRRSSQRPSRSSRSTPS